MLSHVQLFATLWIVACQVPLSMKFSSQEYWSGLPFSSPGDLPKPGIRPRSPALQADSLPSEPPGLQIMLILGCWEKEAWWLSMDLPQLHKALDKAVEITLNALNEWIIFLAQNYIFLVLCQGIEKWVVLSFLRNRCSKPCYWSNWLAIWKKELLDSLPLFLNQMDKLQVIFCT